MYICGPTVWNFAHIGNFRTFTFGDVLRRYLKFKGYNLTHVMNLTDVDDRIINEAKKAGKTIDEFVQPFIEAFWEDFGRARLGATGNHAARDASHCRDD